MNQAFDAAPSRSGAWSRLVGLLIGETALLGVFLFLATSPDRRIDFSNLGAWIEATAPLDILIAVAILAGAAGAFWLFASTMIYVGARLMRLTQLEDGLRRFTLPAARRVVDAAMAISIVGTAVLGGGRLAGAVQQDRPAVQVQESTDRVPGQQLSEYRFAYQQRADGAPTPAGDLDEAPEGVPAPSGGGNGVMARPGAPGAPDTPATNPAPDGRPADDNQPSIPQPADDIPEDGPGTQTPAPTPVEPAPTPAEPGPEPAEPGPEPAEPGPMPAEPAPTPPPTEGAAPSVAGEIMVRPGAPTGGASTGSGDNVASIPGAQSPTQTPPSSPSSPAPVTVPGGGSYTVQEGDNFWTIAAAQVQNKLGRTPSNAEIAPYWEILIEANRANISSGNPSLIFPGEQFTLPPVP